MEQGTGMKKSTFLFKRFAMAVLFLSIPLTAGACKVSPFIGSTKMINAILEDLNNHYKGIGGPITEIKQLATFKWIVSISQEGKIDQMTYDLHIDGSCKPKITKRTASTKTMGPPRNK